MRTVQLFALLALGMGVDLDRGGASPSGSSPGTVAPSACRAYSGLPADWGSSSTSGMVWVERGTFDLGSLHGYGDERPVQRQVVDGFWIDRTEVTNAQFASFVKATKHITTAEIAGGAPVFHIPTQAEFAEREFAWWTFEPGADWRHPDGPASDLSGRANQPVVEVSLDDARAYARWLGRDLPTEAQWEYAARVGSPDGPSSWTPRDASGRPTANFWQGGFPFENSNEDGYSGRAPVGCFAPNGFGLFDMIGNVWEWTRDVYRGEHQAHGTGNPFASVGTLAAPHPTGEPMVIKGGSFLCASNYCARYRATARYPEEADLPAAHVGFRTVRDALGKR